MCLFGFSFAWLAGLGCSSVYRARLFTGKLLLCIIYLRGNALVSADYSSTQCCADLIVVPAMGDSITEGSIAAVLKQPGGLSVPVWV